MNNTVTEKVSVKKHVCYDPEVALFVMQYAIHVLWNNDVYFTAKTIYQGMLEVLFQVMMLHLFQKDFMPVWLQY